MLKNITNHILYNIRYNYVLNDIDMKYKKLNIVYAFIKDRVPTITMEQLPYLLYGFNYLMMFDTGLPGILLDYKSDNDDNDYTLTLDKTYEIGKTTPTDMRQLTTAEIDCLTEICNQFITSEYDSFKEILHCLCPWKAYSIQSRTITPNSMGKLICKKRQMINTFEIE